MKGWIAICISVLALVLSGVTAYFVNFLQIDDLRVITAVDPSDKQESKYSVPAYGS
jgi:hypothetical protein